MGPACWLWDYLRRSDMVLISGIASLSAMLIVEWVFLAVERRRRFVFNCLYCGHYVQTGMKHVVIRHSKTGFVQVVEAVTEGNHQVLADIRRITNDPEYVPKCASEVAGSHTALSPFGIRSSRAHISYDIHGYIEFQRCYQRPRRKTSPASIIFMKSSPMIT